MPDDAVLLVEILKDQDQVKVSLQEGVDLGAQTLHPYSTATVDWRQVYQTCGEVYRALGDYNRDGRLAGESLGNLRRFGGLLFDELFPTDAKECLLGSKSRALIVRIENGLVQIPWELLHDGEMFLCQRWDMGRLVRTPIRPRKANARDLELPLRMVLVADPRGDLPSAYKEGTLIRDMFDREAGRIETELLGSRVETRTVKSLFKDCDIFHYAGHADYVHDDPSLSGLLLADGKITAAEVLRLSGSRGVPSLVFANGCKSGHTHEWRTSGAPPGGGQGIFGLANAFLVAGTRHYVGTFWEVQDELSNRFATHFYQELLAGRPIGHCLRQARREIIDFAGEQAILWATYVLYGDPSFTYIREQPREKEQPAGPRPRPPIPERTHSYSAVRGATEGVVSPVPGLAADSSATAVQRHRTLAIRLGIGALVLGLLLVAGLAWHLGSRHTDRDTSALLRQSEEALFGRGDLANTRASYLAALESGNPAPTQLATLHARLGRIYAQMGDVNQAVAHYENALAIDAGDRTTRSNLCFALNRMGNFAQAAECTNRLLQENPKDSVAFSLQRSLEERIARKEDLAYGDQVRSLVERLEKRAGEEPRTPPSSQAEEWTSIPLTLALLGLEDQGGLAALDGQTEALLFRLLASLQESRRLTVVDRLLLKDVLGELNLGTGNLASADNQLRLGRLLGANLLGQGSVYRDAASVQVNLRFVETETTALRLALSLSFPKETTIEEMAKRLSTDILSGLRRHYPLRGKVVDAKREGTVRLDLGSNVGLAPDSLLVVIPPQGKDARTAFARLQVKDVGDETSTAEVTAEDAPVTPGCRVLEAREPRK